MPGADPDLDLIRDAALAAGRIAMSYFRADPTVWMKAGNSPVSEADLAADTFLKETLLAARPTYGWLSEETADDPARLAAGRVFIVDPIDGTRAFIAGEDSWVVSVAVVEAGRPRAGVLVQPSLGHVWTAAQGGGAYRDGVACRAGTARTLDGARTAAPRKFARHPAFAAAGLIALPHVPSLALRLARVADGSSDIALATGASHDWDIAAADLLLAEAGAAVTGNGGAGLLYNRPSLTHPPLIAANPELRAAAMALMDALSAPGPTHG